MPPENQIQAVAPADARAFLAPFVPDPKLVESMDDKAVVEYHSRFTGTLDKVRPPKGDWRKEMAGDDEKEFKLAERYTTPADVWKKARALENRIASGELRSVLPKDATPEQVTAWRTENGIPAEPTKYDLKLKDGLVIGAEDKPILDSILGKLHGKNVSNEQASELVNAYYEALEAETKKGGEILAQNKQKVSDALNVKWGADYRGNMNRIAALVDANVGATSPLKGMIHATLATNQEFAEFMETMARQINPVTTLIPGAGANVANALADEIKGIEAKMVAAQRAGPGTAEFKAYFGDEALQARYRELLDAQGRMKQAA